jgi:hypothetical protein
LERPANKREACERAVLQFLRISADCTSLYAKQMSGMQPWAWLFIPLKKSDLWIFLVIFFKIPCAQSWRKIKAINKGAFKNQRGVRSILQNPLIGTKMFKRGLEPIHNE